MTTYKMIQIPRDIQVAQYMEGIANQHAADGWEFHRVDRIGASSSTGCLGALLGHKEIEESYYVITFRKG
jgi:hypothetical protein